MKVAVYGANTRSIVLASKVLKEGVDVSVFFDKNRKLSMKSTFGGYQYLDGERILCRYEGIPIDNAENYSKYSFDYIVILAGSVNSFIQESIIRELCEKGISPEKIILYSRLIRNGLFSVVPLGWENNSLDDLLLQMETKGYSGNRILAVSENLLSASRQIFRNEYRLFLLDAFVRGLQAAVTNGTMEVCDIKLDGASFAMNPDLFMYECSDILLDAYEGELSEIEYIEGPYQWGRVVLSEGDVVIDAGANCGLFSAMAASRVHKGSIYAFEPIDDVIRVLEKTTILYDNIEIIPKALSDFCGTAHIDVSGFESNQGTATLMRNTNIETMRAIRTVTLDDFVEEKNLKRVDFIKADIEGAERLFLMGAKNTLKKFAPKLALCTYHYPEDPKLLEFLIKQINPDYIVEHAYKKLYAYI